MICDKNVKSPSRSCAMGFFCNLSVCFADSSPNRGAYWEMDLQYKNRQRRGKEEKAALPVYENS